MASTHALQHLYTRLESGQSPQRVAGYQTLYYSHAGLTREEAMELESRLLYFSTSSSPLKKVFSTTSTGKLAVSHIVPLYVPEQQRAWIGLAHSLVFPEGSAVPFNVFDHFPFISSLEQALAAGDFRTGDIAATEVSDSRQWQEQAIETARHWPADELRKLVFLALRSNRLAKERMAVALVGQPDAIEAVLRLVHLLLPDALCPQCTFDTYFCDDHGNACNLAGVYYWAVGFPSPPSGAQFIIVDAEARSVKYAAKWKPSGPYEQWLEAQLIAVNWRAVAEQRNHLYALAQMLEQKPFDSTLVTGASSDLMRAALGGHAGLVDAWLARRLAEHVGLSLGRRLTGVVRRRYSDAAELLAKVNVGFTPAELADLYFADLSVTGFSAPDEEQIAALGRLLSGVSHAELGLIHATWTGDRVRQQELARHTPEEPYRNAVTGILAARLPGALSLLVSERAALFVQTYLTADASQTIPLTSLAQSLMEIGGVAHLAVLAPRLSRESRDSLRRLRELTAGDSRVPASFRGGFGASK